MSTPAVTEPLKSLKGSCAWEGDEVLRVLADVERFHPEGSMVLSAIRDGEGAIVDFEWTYANVAAERTLGWGVSGLVGRRLHEVPPELGLAGQFEAFHQVVETGQPCLEAFPHTHGNYDGWLQATMVKFRDGVLVRLRDITAARRAEAGLRETRDRMVEILEGTPDGFMSVDATWRFTYVNRNALLLMGKPREKLFGRSLWDACPELLGTVMEREYRRVMAERVPSRFEACQPSGDCWYEIHAYPSGRGISIFFRDVTEKKRTEAERDALLAREHSGRLEAEALARQRAQELLAAREKLIQSEKLAVAGQLAAGVGHEINNPLSFVMGNIHFALEQVSAMAGGEPCESLSLEETVEALQEAREGADRIRGIVQDLKTFARADEAQLRPVDVHAALEFSLSMAMNHIRYRAQVERRYGRVPPVWGNEARLGQVFLNLLINAAQAIPEGDVAHHRITLTTREEGGRVVVEVSDTGVGMAPEVLEHAFEPFFTTKPVGEGMGLGLSICHGIVKALRGELAATSTPGQGSTFRVALPTSSAVEALLPAPIALAETTSVRKRVLVIDDEQGIASVLRRILGHRHEVVVAHSGREALALLERDTNFDRIFCDLMMSDLTGMDVHDALAQKHHECLPRLVFMTGGGFTARARTFLQSVPLPRIDKPVEPEVIRRLVAQAPPRV